MRVTNIDKEGLKHHWDLESVSTAFPSDLSVCPSILFFMTLAKIPFKEELLERGR